VQAWRHAGSEQAAAPAGHVHFIRGALVAVSNPKTIAFFTAFLPQFIDPGLPAGPQLAAMCCVTVLLAVATDTTWAVTSGLGRAWFMRPARAKLLGRLSGSGADRRRDLAVAGKMPGLNRYLIAAKAEAESR
jgi:threonine/homoserine/homoserine lactone efflux protein